MTMPPNDADRAERQARIQDDIRRLFARYRSIGRSSTQSPSPPRYTPLRERPSRFSREDADARGTRSGGG